MSRSFKLLGVLVVTVLLQACVSYSKVAEGTQSIGDRFKFTTTSGWNNLSIAYGPAQQWTREGLTIDRLLVYPGIADSVVIHPASNDNKLKSIQFKSAMSLEEVVTMYQGMFSRDGSTVEITKISPVPFAGAKGIRFEFSMIRKSDEARISGITYAAIDAGKLYALVYQAPRLTFFPRDKDNVEAIARSAKL